ncbi:MAG: NAD(P)/FAD-dependent oxidoreductase [Bacteroidota bacterium]|nr:NAD(P)/FAD-dependent oxidoreductase [Bacteroidota bacterium]
MNLYDIIIVGGGAAGFFAAIAAAENHPGKKILILEKSTKVLSKVRVSGGGRCNVTHACYENYHLIKAYPRGGKFLKIAFNNFSVQDTINWFGQRGVSLKVEDDGRMFPVTDNSQTIIDCLLKEINRLKVELVTSVNIDKVEIRKGATFTLTCSKGIIYETTSLIIAAGGNPKMESYSWISALGHKIVPPVPSLFTFNIPDSDFKDLSGVSVPDAHIRIVGKKLESRGPLLITHWGLSGPAILKASAWGAKELQEQDYNFDIHIKWLAELTEIRVKESFQELKEKHPKKKIFGHSYFGLPSRLWQRLLVRSSILEEQRWIDLSNKQFNQLMENLVRANFKVVGKTTFKEEFVTCGGVELQEIDANSMQSKLVAGLFFAGEVLDVDGITGGYNFQNAWTTGYIAGKNAGLI